MTAFTLEGSVAMPCLLTTGTAVSFVVNVAFRLQQFAFGRVELKPHLDQPFQQLAKSLQMRIEVNGKHNDIVQIYEAYLEVQSGHSEIHHSGKIGW